MSDVREFRVTFGQKYAREPHPHLSGAHPDGWATVWAVDERQARAIAHAHLGHFWTFLYDPDDPAYPTDRPKFSRGELVVLNPEYAP